MFYSILRQIVATAFKIYFRKIYLVGKDLVPEEGPLLIAANHPMAFSEACLLACFLDRPLHFLVRGDVFKSNWNWFFRLTNQIPIYRFRDGFSNMRKNTDSFGWAYQALADQKAILIFAEGNTKLQKKLSPLQKGVARLAFGAVEHKQVEQIQVVPIGINYTDGIAFRSDVMIQIGQPLAVDQYLEAFRQDRHEATRKLTHDLHTLMQPLVIHLEDSEDEEVLEALVRDSAAQLDPWPIVDPDPIPFQGQKKWADQVNALSDEEKRQMWLDLVEKNQAKAATNTTSPGLVMVLILFFPIAVLGFISNAIPFYVAKWISDRKVRQIEFYTPVRITLMIVTFSLYLLLLGMLLAGWFGWGAILVIVLIMFAGYGTVVWWEVWQHSIFGPRTRSNRIQAMGS